MAILHRTLTATAAAAALAGAFALPVWAQNTPAPAAPVATQTAPAAGKHHAARPHQDRAAQHTQRLDRVKPLLQLTAAQEGAWQKYVDATRPAQRSAQERPDREAWSKLTTPERIEKAQSLRKERNAAAEQRENATKTFYASLNPAQQKAFDVAMPLQRHGKGHGMHKGGHRHGVGHPGMPSHRGHGMDRPAPQPAATGA